MTPPTNPYASARQEIETMLATVADAAGAIFLGAARAHLDQFNLKRHRFQLEPNDIVVHENRRDGSVYHSYWWDLPDCTIRQALYDMYHAYHSLPELARARLAGTFL